MSKAEYVFVLPDLGEGLTHGELREIRIGVGDVVLADQLALVVETTKATIELPLPFAGQVVEIHGEVGDIIPVGDPLLTLLTDEELAEASPQFQHLVGRRNVQADAARTGRLTRGLPPRKQS